MVHFAVLTLVSHWRRQPGQAFTLVAGLALAPALWSAVQAINVEARGAYDTAAGVLGQDRLTRVVARDGRPIPLDTYVALRRAGHRVSPVIEGIWETGDARLRILGFDPLTAPPGSTPVAVTDDGDLAAFIRPPGLLLVGAGTASEPLARTGSETGPATRIVDTVPSGAAVTDIATAARLLDRSDPSYLLLDPRQRAGADPTARHPDLRLEAPQGGDDIARLTDSFHLNLTAFGLLAFGVGLFIVQGAVGLAAEQRRAGMRTLRALGIPLRAVLAAFGLEMAVLGLVAGGIGLVLGYLIAGALMPGVAATLRGLYGAEVPGVLRFDPSWAAWGLGMTLAGMALAAARAFAALSRMPLLAPARPRAWAVASARRNRGQAVAALALGAGGVSVLLLGDGLWAGFGFLAGLLLAAALLLPVLLQAILAAAARLVPGAVAAWALADTRQQAPGLSLALMALLLAVAANVGVSTMVGSFRATFLGWLDQRLVAELYVTAASPDEAARLLAFVAGRAEAALPIQSARMRLFEQPVEVFGIVDHATYRDHWPLLSGTRTVWDDIDAGKGVLLNEQLVRRMDLNLGDAIELTPDVTLPLAGVYSDYGNPGGQAIIGMALFRDLHPGLTPLRYALRVPDDRAAALAADLREDLGLPDAAVVDRLRVKRFSIGVFDRTFQITGALNVLTLAVAGFAILTSLMTLSAMRLPQLAPVWALGLTRRTLAWLELARALLLALLTAVLALPVGLALAWALLAVVNVEAFGWRLPMTLFPRDWAVLAALVLLTAALSAAWPAWRLASVTPDRLLRVFADDR